MKPITLKVKTKDISYPIIIGNNLVYKLNLIFKKNQINFSKCLFIIDNKINKKIIFKIVNSFKKKNVEINYFNANEKNKNQKNVNKILDILLKKNFNRNDCLIAIGGGIVGDVSGFSASIYKRGLKFINIPTTLLSQVDSSIGGKTGINTIYGKNLIGSFYQPSLVISDTNFLKTLPKREIVCGYGEIFKHSLINNKNFFKFLNSNYSKVIGLKSPYIEKTLYESCKIKKNIIQKDEKEKSLRKILNFGHTFAHAYEASMGYSKKLNHGEAVLLGISSALKFSLRKKIIDKKEFSLIQNHIFKSRLPNDLKKFFKKREIKKIVSFMLKDKKNTSKKINLILLKKIGSVDLKKEFTTQDISSFLKEELIY
jgi:3-dehydroquinate synthase/shikimate kinase/3-dehydroquinate synthase|tara:strand:- start:706 stop:1812 length:1107 start_codon:yes stop_codon:yes gene_type:complete